MGTCNFGYHSDGSKYLRKGREDMGGRGASSGIVNNSETTTWDSGLTAKEKNLLGVLPENERKDYYFQNSGGEYVED